MRWNRCWGKAISKWGMEKEEDAIPDCVYHSYLRDLLMVASDFVFLHEFKQQITEQFFI